MPTNVLRARKGVQLIETTVMSDAPAVVVSRTYTVKSRHLPDVIHEGSDFDAAESAFEKATAAPA